MERITGFEAGSLPTIPSREIILTQNMPYVVGGETLPQDAPKLADLPEFQGITNPDHLLAMELLDHDVMVGFTLNQKRDFLVYFAWQNATTNDEIQRPLGVSASEKLEAIDRVAEGNEERYDRFVGIVELVKYFSRNDVITQGFGEIEYWVYQTLTSLPELEFELLSHLPEEFRSDDLSDDALRAKIAAYVQKIKDDERLARYMKRKDAIDGDDQVPAKKTTEEPKIEEPKSKEQLMREVFKRIGRVPVISDFDMWVYRNWFLGKELPSEFASSLPTRFKLNNINNHDLLVKISVATLKLKNYGIIETSFTNRVISKRRDRIHKIYGTRGSLPKLIDLANLFGVDRAIIVRDLAHLRKNGLLPRNRHKLTPLEIKEMSQKIRLAIALCEKDGRRYVDGEIQESEIAKILNIKIARLRQFIMTHGEKAGIPSRKSIKDTTRHKTELTRDKVRQILLDNSDMTSRQLYNLVTEKVPDYKMSFGTFRNFKRQVLNEQKR